MQVRQPSIVASVAADNAAAAYSSGDQVGSILKISNAVAESKAGAELESVVVVDTNKQTGNLELFFFSQQPTGTAGDNGAADFSAADAAYCLGSVIVSTWASLANRSVGNLLNTRLRLAASKSQSKDLWVMIVTRAGTTWTAASSITLRLGLKQN